MKDKEKKNFLRLDNYMFRIVVISPIIIAAIIFFLKDQYELSNLLIAGIVIYLVNIGAFYFYKNVLSKKMLMAEQDVTCSKCGKKNLLAFHKDEGKYYCNKCFKKSK